MTGDRWLAAVAVLIPGSLLESPLSAMGALLVSGWVVLVFIG